MLIQTKFSVGDQAYLQEYAQRGLLMPVRIISVKVLAEYGNPSIDYQVYGTMVYYNSWYPEDKLKTFLEAKQIASQALYRTGGNVEDSLETLLGDFSPITTKVTVTNPI